jgi:MFS family permease
VLAFAQLIIAIDYNIVYVALPEIGDALGFSTETLQWVISAYAVAFGGFLLLGARACDLSGPRRMFVLGLVLYAVSSLAGGLATTPGTLIAARAVQGLGGALLFPSTLTLVSTGFAAGRERNRAFAVWGTAGGTGMILGSLLGSAATSPSSPKRRIGQAHRGSCTDNLCVRLLRIGRGHDRRDRDLASTSGRWVPIPSTGSRLECAQ